MQPKPQICYTGLRCYTYRAPYVAGFKFIKPLESSLLESRGSEKFYYATLLRDHTRRLSKLATRPTKNHNTKAFYSKKEIDLLPRHLRRGGEYGHDAVIVKRRDKTKEERENKLPSYREAELARDIAEADHLIKICKVRGISIRFQ